MGALFIKALIDSSATCTSERLLLESNSAMSLSNESSTQLKSTDAMLVRVFSVTMRVASELRQVKKAQSTLRGFSLVERRQKKANH